MKKTPFIIALAFSVLICAGLPAVDYLYGFRIFVITMAFIPVGVFLVILSAYLVWRHLFDL